ncbi:MAG TPA: hypothetical protein VLH56_15180 [Dissulfurispiraceae bacterium]|nr:hypothetical protein [Dissulfurispiraceae bacterium]
MKHFGGIAWDVSWRDAEQWNAAIQALSDVFRTDAPERAAARLAAERVRELINAVDPFIQEQTAVVCPHCTGVCCIDRHGSFDLHDLVYAFCLKLPIPRYERCRNETDPCQFLDATGCRLPRHERPFRCTWHFCEALIAHMQTLPAKQVRDFNAAFQELQRVRHEMLGHLRQSASDQNS